MLKTGLAGLALLLASLTGAHAEISDNVVKIGVLNDISGIFQDTNGMGSVEAARLNQSSYPAYLRQTDASDLTMSTYGIGNGGATNYSAKTAAAIARVPAASVSRGRGLHRRLLFISIAKRPEDAFNDSAPTIQGVLTLS